MEHILHKHFRPYRVQGEWFQAAPAVMDFIDDLRKGLPLEMKLCTKLKRLNKNAGVSRLKAVG